MQGTRAFTPPLGLLHGGKWSFFKISRSIYGFSKSIYMFSGSVYGFSMFIYGFSRSIYRLPTSIYGFSTPPIQIFELKHDLTVFDLSGMSVMTLMLFDARRES